MNKDLSKKDLRIQAKEIRHSLDLQQISKNICEQIFASQFFDVAQNIGIFYPKDIEINLLSLCKKKDKNFYLPKIQNKNLIFVKFNSEQELIKAQYDIFEPQCTKDESEKLDLIFVPALMADQHGYRLGWGGGFYDKFLKNHAQIAKICAIPHCQLIENLPTENHDIACEIIVTEKEVIKIKK